MYNEPGKIDALPPDCQAVFSQLAEALEYSPGQIICHQGDKDGYLYLLKSGTLSVIREDEHGEKRKLATITAGSFFGEINFIFGAERVASVVCDSKVEVSRLSVAKKNDIIKKIPALYNRLYDLGLNRWGMARFLQNPLIRSLAKEDQDSMLNEAVTGTYVSGTVLFDQGDRVDDLILLLSGTLDLAPATNGADGKELGDGDWLLPAGSLQGGASIWRATAVIECMVMFIPLAAVQGVAARHQAFAGVLASGCSV